MKRVLAVAVTALLFAGGTSQVQAAFTLRIDSGGFSSTIDLDTGAQTVGGSGQDMAFTRNVVSANEIEIVFANTYGYRTTATVNLRNFLTGNLEFSLTNLTRVVNPVNPGQFTAPNAVGGLQNVQNNITFTLSANPYTGPGTPRVLDANSTVFASTGTTVTTTFSSTYTPAVGPASSLSGTYTGDSNTPGNFPISNPTGIIVPGSGNYTLTNVLGFTNFDQSERVNIGGVIANVSLLVVPAPSALLLGLLGVPAFGMIRRFTRKGAVAPAEQPVAA